jgi:hypothetical protein
MQVPQLLNILASRIKGLSSALIDIGSAGVENSLLAFLEVPGIVNHALKAIHVAFEIQWRRTPE